MGPLHIIAHCIVVRRINDQREGKTVQYPLDRPLPIGIPSANQLSGKGERLHIQPQSLRHRIPDLCRSLRNIASMPLQIGNLPLQLLTLLSIPCECNGIENFLILQAFRLPLRLSDSLRCLFSRFEKTMFT